MSWVTVHSLIRKHEQAVEYLRFWSEGENCIKQHIPPNGGTIFALQVKRDLPHVIQRLETEGWTLYSTLEMIVPGFLETWLSTGPDLDAYFNELWHNRYDYRVPHIDKVKSEIYEIEGSLR